MNNQKKPISAERKKQIAEEEGFPVEQLDRFVVFIGEEPYITGAGLQYKMLDTYGVGKFAVQAVIPTPEEYALIRRMMGLTDAEPLVVTRGEVWIEGFQRPFVDYGTATPKNLKGFVKFSDYPLEMSNRRATNRAMRLATATGMCSVDEIKTPEEEHAGATQGNGNGTVQPPVSATENQLKLIRSLKDNTFLTDEERLSIQAELDNVPTKERAGKLIERIKVKIEERKSEADKYATADAQ